MDSSPNIQHDSTGNRKTINRSLPIVGLILIIGGLLAYIIPEMSVPPGSGDTSAAWAAGLTQLFCAVPLIILGGLLLLILAWAGASKKDK